MLSQFIFLLIMVASELADQAVHNADAACCEYTEIKLSVLAY